MAPRKGMTSEAAEKVVHQKVLYQGASLLAPQAAQNEYRALAPAPFLPAKMTFSAACSVVPKRGCENRGVLTPEESVSNLQDHF
jgi:hypothetical protein